MKRSRATGTRVSGRHQICYDYYNEAILTNKYLFRKKNKRSKEGTHLYNGTLKYVSSTHWSILDVSTLQILDM